MIGFSCLGCALAALKDSPATERTAANISCPEACFAMNLHRPADESRPLLRILSREDPSQILSGRGLAPPLKLLCMQFRVFVFSESYLCEERFYPLPVGLPHHCDGLHRGKLRGAGDAEMLSLARQPKAEC